MWTGARNARSRDIKITAPKNTAEVFEFGFARFEFGRKHGTLLLILYNTGSGGKSQEEIIDGNLDFGEKLMAGGDLAGDFGGGGAAERGAGGDAGFERNVAEEIFI